MNINLIDEDRYKMNNRCRGIALIVNNYRFESNTSLGVRHGSDVDEQNLKKTFAKLDFDVHVKHNQSARNLRKLFDYYAQQDFSNSDCFAAIILSHGDTDGIYGTDTIVPLECLMEPLQRSVSLVGKPKLLFIQACRGSKLNERIHSTNGKICIDAKEQLPSIQSIPIKADFLFAYATLEGHYAWRNVENGSWFVQTLCQIFDTESEKKEILHLLTKIQRRISYHYHSNCDDNFMNNRQQMPCFVSTLTKELYFGK
ncbi:hypothetical protein SNEBB_002276 [Seison nebaliae]|nr:hypothetical protein SNEBB_002276 [Seison nebaliae]